MLIWHPAYQRHLTLVTESTCQSMAHVTVGVQGVPMEDVLRVLRKRFGTSGIEEKASRKPKEAAAAQQ